MTIKGLNGIVNKTLIRTTLQRLISRYGVEVLIVDAYGWMHAGKSITGVVELLSCGHPCPPLYHFFERRLSTISLRGKLRVWLVFDGPSSLQKESTEDEREKQRKERRDAGLEAQKNGQYAKATPLLRNATEITPTIAKGVIDHLNALPVERKRQIGLARCVVSINEADPLLSHLNWLLPNSCVISRDYDMVPWNTKMCCFKVDYNSGLVHLYMREVFDVSAVVSRKILQLTQEQLIDCCVMAGCDYVKSLKDVGFITAAGLIRVHGN